MEFETAQFRLSGEIAWCGGQGYGRPLASAGRDYVAIPTWSTLEWNRTCTACALSSLPRWQVWPSLIAETISRSAEGRAAGMNKRTGGYALACILIGIVTLQSAYYASAQSNSGIEKKFRLFGEIFLRVQSDFVNFAGW